MTERARIPIACSLDAGQVGDRLGWWRAVMAHAIGEPVTVEGGVRVRLPSALEVEVRRLVAAESECCAFFDFDVASADGTGDVVLTVGAPPEARPLIDSLLAGP